MTSLSRPSQAVQAAAKKGREEEKKGEDDEDTEEEEAKEGMRREGTPRQESALLSHRAPDAEGTTLLQD